MSVSAYPAYRDSGVDWLGVLPTTWREVPFWSLFRRVKRTGFADAELLSVYRDYGVIRKTDRDDNFNNASDDLGSYQLVEPGDLAINKMKAWQGSLGISRHRGIVSPAYFVYHARHAERPEYLHYLLRSMNYATGFMTISKGIRINQWDVDPDQLAKVVIPLPSVSEQAAIAAFLDRETAKIDALVEEQRRLIALLKEKRQAVISHAVTKGLNPDAPMKDSGIEWLGEVPAYWEIKAIRHFSDVLRGKFTHRPRNDPAFYDGDFPFIQTGDITGAARYITTYKQTLNERGASVSKEFPSGTLVMAIAANIGDVAILNFPAYFPDSIVGLAPKDGVILEFLYYLMQGMKQPMLMTATVSTQMNLNVDQIVSMIAGCPPCDEQRSIVAHLDGQIRLIDELEAEAGSLIVLMQERRAALISAAVTGKIDVRGLVPKSVELEAA